LKPDFWVIPAVDLREGKCVQLVGGDYANERVRIPDPLAVARDWQQKGAPWLHVVDLDRATGRGSNLQVVKQILQEARVPVSVGGGIRFTEDIDDLLNAGAARVIVGTRAVTDPVWLEAAAARYGKRMAVAVDARGDEIVIKGWAEGSGVKLLDFAKQCDHLGLGALLYTDVGREGQMVGANVEAVGRLAAAVRTPVIASGGVATHEDLVRLRDAGAAGAVLGMSIYTGRIDLARSIQLLQEGARHG